MEINLSFLCQAANKMPSGELNVLGLFTKINHFQMPLTVSMTLVLRLTASPGEKGTSHVIKVVIVDEDGSVIAPPLPMPVTIPENLPGADVEMHAIVGMNGVTFQKFGAYRVDVTIDDQSKTQLAFVVNPMALPPGHIQMTLPRPPE